MLRGVQNNKLYMKVLSYNILADCYSHYFMFKYVDHAYLKFGFRSYRILEEIKSSDSDIICLQEVDHIKDFYKPRLEQLGYDLQFTLRREKDAVMVGYKRDQFVLIKSEPVDYNDVAELFDDKSLKLHNKAIICLLQHKESLKYFIVISSHLYWGQDFVRSAQILYLIKRLSSFIENEVEKLMSKGSQISVIACGDFNSGINKPAIKMMYGDQTIINQEMKTDSVTKEDSTLLPKDSSLVQDLKLSPKEWELYKKILVEYKKEAEHLNRVKFLSAYQNYFEHEHSQQCKIQNLTKVENNQETQQEGPVQESQLTQDYNCRVKGHPLHTNFTSKYQDHFDYIFHTNDMSVESLLEVPTLDVLTKETALPNKMFPSDHLRMEAILSMKL
eukprot:403364523